MQDLAFCRCLVGNDVVDLAGYETLPPRRFVERICTPGELARHEPCDGQQFWTLFAAKEAAFKALKKALPALAFVPRDFVVSTTLDSVGYANRRLELRVTATNQWVHALAHESGAQVAWCVAELRAAESESEGARRLLRELAETHPLFAIRDFSVVRDADPNAWDGRGVPRAYAGGRPASVDVSLSHDGRYAACALSSAREGESRAPSALPS